LPAKLISRGRFTYAEDLFPGWPDSAVIVKKSVQQQRPLDFGTAPSGSWQVHSSALILHERLEIRGMRQIVSQ
jgi:hypothetical protein